MLKCSREIQIKSYFFTYQIGHDQTVWNIGYKIGVGKHMLIPTHCWGGCGQVQTICRAIYYDLPKITNAHTLQSVILLGVYQRKVQSEKWLKITVYSYNGILYVAFKKSEKGQYIAME